MSILSAEQCTQKRGNTYGETQGGRWGGATDIFHALSGLGQGGSVGGGEVRPGGGGEVVGGAK